MEPVFEQALLLLKRGEQFIMTVMCESDGSTPRKKGAKMLIRSDGTIFATIGGGILESEAIKHGQKALAKGISTSFTFDMSAKDVHNSELICGGKGRIILSLVTPHELPVFEALCDAINSGIHVSYVLRGNTLPESESWNHFCAYKDGTVICAAGMSETDGVSGAAAGLSIHTEDSDDVVFYVEPVIYDGKVYLLGGGHVAAETAKVAHIAGFRTAVAEDRETFITEQRFPYSERLLIDSFSQMPELKIREDDYIVILTRGHKFDRETLQWALGTPAGYIGMIGSLTKRNLIYTELMKNGVTRERLQEVHSPIGIKLGGQTPGEIAVSIVAELISVRAGRQKQ